MSKCVFAGTFDPLTIGHANIINKCINAYEEVFIVIGENSNKKPLFPLEIRYNAVKNAFLNSAKVIKYADYKDDYKKFLIDNKIEYYIRGIRSDMDRCYEDENAKANKKLYPFIKTIYLSPDEGLQNISSTLVRNLILTNGDYSSFIPKGAREVIENYLTNK